MFAKVVKVNKAFFWRILGHFLMLEISASGKDAVFQTTSDVSKKPWK